jgi:drug/metabolite transporter (DMT)-like permease
MSIPDADTTLRTAVLDSSTPRINPYIGLTAATLAVSCSAILIKESSAPSLVIATYRLAMTTVLLLPFLRRERLARLRALDKRTAVLLVASGFLLAIHFATWTASLRYTTVASSVLFVTVHPALVAAAAWIGFGERAGKRAILGIALTLAGSAVVAGGDIALGGEALRGDALAFLGALVFAGYLLIGRGARQNMDNIGYSLPVYAVCALVLAALSLGYGQSLASISAADLLIFLALALLPTIGGHLLYNWTLRYLPAAVVSVSFLGEPVGASLLAWPILGQQLAPSTVLGGAIILVGIWLTAQW